MRAATATIVVVLFALGEFVAADVPSSSRSREAASRVTPALTESLSAKGLHFGSPIFIRIIKESKELEVWVQAGARFKRFKTYDICTYSVDLGPKLRTGDRQGPEGFYFVTPERMNPSSQFHLSFNLGYPNAYDRAYNRTGSLLMVHGNCVSIGCYAMTDAGIEEIYTLADAALRNGQSFFRVHIFPFHLTTDNLESRCNSKWADFWSNLKEGYDWFEQHDRPPNVEVNDRLYVFGE